MFKEESLHLPPLLQLIFFSLDSTDFWKHLQWGGKKCLWKIYLFLH